MVEVDVNILIMAMRYALGRRTYAPLESTEVILNNIDNIKNHQLSIMIKDIDYQIKISGMSGLGDKCDIDTWLNFRNKLKEELINRE